MAKLTREEVEQLVNEVRNEGKKPDLSRMDLSDTDLSQANLSETHLIGTVLSQASLSGTILSEANLTGANLSGANLNHAVLTGAYLIGADLSRANLSGANLTGAKLTGAHLSGADLNHVVLAGADLSGADLRGVDLRGADLRWVNLSGAKLRGADLSEAYLFGTIFADVALSEVKGLDRVRHIGPSEITLNTVYRSGGNIPERFLRGTGVPETYITSLGSLAKEAVEYYACFISYSPEDEEFARRLQTDLQNHGVRCWEAPEDLKTGSRIRHSIGQSIRIHDKLLLILSEQAVASPWIEREVEHALALELERGEPVLFPIRLDEAGLESNLSWTGQLKKGRYIGDFTHWKDPGAYQEGFDRLLRDLKGDN